MPPSLLQHFHSLVLVLCCFFPLFLFLFFANEQLFYSSPPPPLSSFVSLLIPLTHPPTHSVLFFSISLSSSSYSSKSRRYSAILSKSGIWKPINPHLCSVFCSTPHCAHSLSLYRVLQEDDVMKGLIDQLVGLKPGTSPIYMELSSGGGGGGGKNKSQQLFNNFFGSPFLPTTSTRVRTCNTLCCWVCKCKQHDCGEGGFCLFSTPQKVLHWHVVLLSMSSMLGGCPRLSAKLMMSNLLCQQFTPLLPHQVWHHAQSLSCSKALLHDLALIATLDTLEYNHILYLRFDEPSPRSRGGSHIWPKWASAPCGSEEDCVDAMAIYQQYSSSHMSRGAGVHLPFAEFSDPHPQYLLF